MQAQSAASTTYSNLGSGTWNIVGSTTTVDARDNTGTNPTGGTDVPIYLLDGTTLFSANNSDMWNGILSSNVSLDQNGDALSDNRTWTGSDGDGTNSGGATNNLALGEGTAGGPNVRTGNSALASGGWMIDFNSDPDNQSSVYAMSGVLTVVPEPASLALLGLGSLAMLVRRRRG